MRTEKVDVCIIGSGAAGAIVAHEAAKRGLSTLVVERGPYLRARDMQTDELEMIPRLYKDGGMQLNTGLDFFILQGSCVGGSTVVSNMVLMRPPDEVFAQWARLGTTFDVDAMHLRYDEIEQTLGARRMKLSARSRSTELFVAGASSLGLETHAMLKALGDCVACGNCNIGCVFGSKRSALTTFVVWAEREGARILPDTTVTRIVMHGRRAAGVLATNTKTNERIRIDARKVVIAAGAIGSSALLLASGVRKNVGKRLSFNVGAMMVAEFDAPLESFDADQMTVYLAKDGYLIEPTHNPIMSAALTTPGWLAEHSQLMGRVQYLAYAGAMTGSEPTGEVVWSRWMGHEETRFSANAHDMATLREGLKTIARTYFAAGAKRVFLPTERFTALDSAAEVSLVDERIRVMRDVQCGSSHPQGGNPMSDDPSLGAVNTHFGVHGIDGLFVCDASVFPTSVGVNPMHTVMALARVGADRILAA